MESAKDLNKERLLRETLGEGDDNAPDTDADLGAKLLQAVADGAALGLGHGGALQAQTAQRAQQDVGKGAEVQAQLIGARPVGAGGIGVGRTQPGAEQVLAPIERW